jgi:hypothetical protein
MYFVINMLLNNSDAAEITSNLTSTFPSTSPTSTLTVSEKQYIGWLGAEIAGLGLVGSLFVVASYFIFPKLRSFAFYLILMVAIADIFEACAYILTPRMYPFFCKPQAILLAFSDLATLSWVWAIAFTIDGVIFRDSFGLTQRPCGVNFHIICWGGPLLLSLLPLATSNYDSPDDGYCWISFQNETGIPWALISHFIPFFLILCYIIKVYYKVRKVLKAHPLKVLGTPDSQKVRYRYITKTRITLYPAIYIVSVLLACTDRIYQWVSGKRMFSLALLNVIATSLKTILNSLVYGFTAAVRLE